VTAAPGVPRERLRAGLARCRARLARAVAGCAILAAMVLMAVPASAQAPVALPSQVEAVFLFNFTQFVSWPANAFATDTSPLVLCVLGEDPFGSYLDETIRDERIGARALALRRYSRIEDAGDCHILFISRSEAANLAAILQWLNGRSILTVSDAEDFGRRGGMVRFVVEEGRVRLRVNVAAAQAVELTISSKLLRVADIVRQAEP
jgi:hypothetical protein